MVKAGLLQGFTAYSDISPLIFGMLIVALAMWPANIAQAASFDCTKATTKVEKMICADAELSKLDEEMARVYASALADGNQVETVKKEQRAWLKTRSACADTACLKASYDARKTLLASSPKIGIEAAAPQEEQAASPPVPGMLREASLQRDSSQLYTFKEVGYQTDEEVKDSGWIVCNDLKKNLMKLQPSPAAFETGVPFHPSMKQFSYPKWQELNIEDFWREVFYIEQRLDSNFLTREQHGEKYFDEWLQQYQEDLHNGVLSRFVEEQGKWHRWSLHPRLRMTQVRFEKDGPLLTVLGYARERQDVQRWRETMDIFDRCPNQMIDKKFETKCLDPKDKGLFDKLYAKWGNAFWGAGDHLYLYNPETRKIGSFSTSEESVGSDIPQTLILHYDRAYTVTKTSRWGVYHFKPDEDNPDGTKEANYNKRVCVIKMVADKNNR